ncbi:MAG: hypothetical protein MPF33_05605 [Candidatus Aramenus sp.]|nr:hypothetical protein [Candidatus Aramenus sp.]
MVRCRGSVIGAWSYCPWKRREDMMTPCGEAWKRTWTSLRGAPVWLEAFAELTTANITAWDSRRADK